MKIRSKLLLGNLCTGLLVALLGALAVSGISAIDKEYQTLSTSYLPYLQTLQDTRFAASRMVSSTIEFSSLLQRGGTVNRELLQRETEQRHDAVIQLREASARLQRFASTPPEDTRLLQRVVASSESLIAAGDALVAASARKSPIDIDLQREAYEDQEVAFFKELEVAVSTMRRLVANKQATVDASVSQHRQWILLLAIAVAIMAAGVGLGVAQVIIGRIEQLRQAASRFAHAEDPEALTVPGTDELRDLAEALNRMAGDLRQSRLDVVNGRDFLSEIINSMADSLVVLNADGLIIMVNAATHALLGYEEELVGQPFAKIMRDPPLAEVTDRGILWNVEAEFLNRSGIPIPVAFSCSVLWNPDSSLRGFVCVALDITQIKETEATLKRYAAELQLNNEELRNFAYIVSHDLRAPLVNIKGFSCELQDLLLQLPGKLPLAQLPADDRHWLQQEFLPESDQSLRFISSSVSRMEGLISGLLKLSRLGHRELAPEEVDVRQLLQQLVATFSHQLTERHANVEMQGLPIIIADRVALEQIFANLLDNAVKYLEPSRTGQIKVDAELSDGGMTFRVSDNGRGIAQVDMEKIFDIFRRAGQEDVPGEGMGLAYVRTMVKRLGGQIWCESILGAGTTFFLTLPCPVIPRLRNHAEHSQ